MILAPSGPPQTVTVTAIGRTTISVRWDRVDCLQRNSNISGYIVSYGRRGNESDSETETVMGTTDRTYTVMGLMTSTEYFVMVAAMNSDGVTGPFSSPVLVQTLSKWDVCKIGTTNLNLDLWVPPVSEFSWALSIVFAVIEELTRAVRVLVIVQLTPPQQSLSHSVTFV